MKLEASPRKEKKWRATFEDGTHTDFGDASAEDFTQHGDKVRRDRYRQRHKKDLNTGDPKRAGFLSYYILWGSSTSIAKNLAAYKKAHPSL